MQTITVDILNEKALSLLRNLEKLNLIKLQVGPSNDVKEEQDWSKFKGAMSKQSLDKIDSQLNEIRG